MRIGGFEGKELFYEVEVIFEVYFAFVPWRVDRHVQ